MTFKQTPKARGVTRYHSALLRDYNRCPQLNITPWLETI